MNFTTTDMAIALVTCVLGGAIHHLVMLCVLGNRAVYVPIGVLIVAVGFSELMPWSIAACAALVGHVLLEVASRRRRRSWRLRLVVDNTK